ncbi:amidohydrolase [Dickeya fangzhongdai]|uniref:amidohydrolase n=1 Tax=Dickeya fangzhongdai TaxID=1778540 RepID=UPI0026E053BE|nr:amidohydrolase [Dickeya fangzhongdai]WKV51581.1 amidohydrolase [Dickeya fangzhongdai]
MTDNELAALRRDRHAHPELGVQAHRTAERVADFLAACGLEVHTGIGGTGVVGVLHGRNRDHWVGQRADMDALPMDEQIGQPWRSQHSGAHHACGHDGHTAMLLGAARQLARQRDVDGTVCFIFQPAEEGLGGAREMVNAGLFDRFPCEQVFALHNWPGLPLGTVQTRPGPIMAAADRFDIRVFGGGGHAAQPHLTPDTLLATSEMVVQLNTLVSRAIAPVESGLLSVTRIQGGSSHNMIPAQATVTGTVRTFNPAVQDRLEQRLREVAHHVTAAHGLQAEVTYLRYYPATINGEAQAHLALEAAQAAGLSASLAPQPALTSEDFAFMLQARPGAYAWLGAGDSYPLHHPQYDFNDALIPYGVRWLSQVARRAAGPRGGDTSSSG